MDPALDAVTVIAIVVLAVFFVLLIGYGIIRSVRQFVMDLRYINMELERTGPKERPYWLRQRRQLWLSLLPFYRADRS